jgi:hypothetical protein
MEIEASGEINNQKQNKNKKRYDKDTHGLQSRLLFEHFVWIILSINWFIRQIGASYSRFIKITELAFNLCQHSRKLFFCKSVD